MNPADTNTVPLFNEADEKQFLEYSTSVFNYLDQFVVEGKPHKLTKRSSPSKTIS
jgi:hypothetical protein